MRMTKIYLKRFSRPMLLLICIVSALISGVVAAKVSIPNNEQMKYKEVKRPGIFGLLGMKKKVAVKNPESTFIVQQEIKEMQKEAPLKYKKVRISVLTFDRDGKKDYRYIYKNQIYTAQTMPVLISWSGGVPYVFEKIEVTCPGLNVLKFFFIFNKPAAPSKGLDLRPWPSHQEKTSRDGV